MSIEFRCPNCEKKLRTGEDKAGKSAKCPQCGTMITVPAAVTEENDFGDFPAFDEAAPPRMAAPSRRGAAPSGQIACPMCGTMNDAGATACLACGEELYPAAEPGTAGQVARFDVGDQFSKGVDLFKADMGTCIAATIVYLLVPGAINFVIGMIVGGVAVAIAGAGGDPVLQNVIQQSSQIPSFFVQVFFDAGYTLFLLNVIRRRPASVGDVFAGGPYFLSLALNRFVLFLMTALPFLPAVVPIALMAMNNPADPTLYVVAILALGMVGAVVSAALWTVLWPHCWVIVDRNPGGLVPLKASAHLTSGHRWEIVLMGLLFWLLSLAGVLACCVGLIFALPVATLMSGIGYDRLIRAKGLGT